MSMQTNTLWGQTPIILASTSFATEAEMTAYLQGVADSIGFSDSPVVSAEAAVALDAVGGGFGSPDWEALAIAVREHEGKLPVGAAWMSDTTDGRTELQRIIKVPIIDYRDLMAKCSK